MERALRRERGQTKDLPLTRTMPLAMLRSWTKRSTVQAAEIRDVSFIACRIRDFQDLTRSYAPDAEGLCAFVRRAAALMTESVHGHGGTIHRISAGGLGAYFDARASAQPHAIRACECAL